jgi:Aerotolerance regulator N-terminal/von Willebrand factor type A domain
MGFLSPWFLLGLAAIGLPVYIHLLRRHTTTPQPFSSLMFFERGTQSSTRHRRLRHLLLFSLRAALLLLLVLAFANPFVRLAGGSANEKLLLLVVDNSYSMKAGSRFVEAKQAALQKLASRPQSQRAEVMALGGRLAVLTQPVQDSGALRSAVDSIQPGDSRANLGELARGVRALAETVRTPIELHLFSDMQKTGMPANFADMELPANVSVVLHPAGSVTASPNWTVEAVNAPAQLADPKDPKKSRVQAVIAGYGAPAASRTVSLVVNGTTIATRKVEIPPDGRATIEFQPLDVPYGLNRCAVRIDSTDSFPADDESVFAVKRSDPERVLFVHPASDARSPLYFGAALAAANQASFSLQSIDSEKSTDIDPAKYAFVVLSDAIALPSLFENALLQYVRSGGSVLIAAGTSAAHHGRIPIFGGYSSDAHSYARDGYGVVGETDLTHPTMNEANGKSANDAASSSTKEAGGWADLKLFYVAGVDASQARVIVRLSDRTPLLMEKRFGEGKVLLFASGFDNLTNDLPVRPAFVSFVDRTARYLSGSDDVSGSTLVDTYVPLRSAAPQGSTPSAGVEIIDPDGHRALSLTEAAAAQSFQLTRAGFYQIRFANGRNALIGVNPDRRESDLEPIANDLLQLWGVHSATPSVAPGGSPSSGLVQQKNSRSLWWYVMLLVLVAAVAESIIASRYLGTQREEA